MGILRLYVTWKIMCWLCNGPLLKADAELAGRLGVPDRDELSDSPDPRGEEADWESVDGVLGEAFERHQDEYGRDECMNLVIGPCDVCLAMNCPTPTGQAIWHVQGKLPVTGS